MAEAVAILLDVGPHMNLIPHGKTDSYLEISLDCIQMILQRKMFAESKDEVALVMFGTDNTANDLAAEGGGYDHITVAQPLAKVSWPMLQFVNDEMKTSSSTADFMDALVVACDHLMRASAAVKKKKFESKSIVLFSNLYAPFGDDQAEEIIGGLKNSEIDLTVIGPNLDESGNSQNDDDSESAIYRNQKTPQQKAGELMIKQVLDELGGECYSFDEAVQALSLFQKKSVKQINYKYNLETANMQIPVRMCTKVSEVKTKTLKKVHATASDTPTANERTYHLSDEQETTVEKEELINAHRYGNTLVPFSEEDTDTLKFTADKCLKVLGFTKNKNIKRHHFTGTSVLCVMPEPGDEVAAVAFSALVHALYELDTVIIVRRVYQNRATPKLGLMTPHIKVGYHCLLYSELPFAEDLRQYTFGSLPLNEDVPEVVKKMKPNEEQLNAMDALITEMNLCPKDEENEEEILKPKLTFNPYRQRLFQCILHRGLNQDVEDLPELNPIVAEGLKIPPEVLNKAEPVQEKMKDLFKLVRVPQKKEEEVGSGEPAPKKPKLESVKTELSEIKTESEPKDTVKEISSVTPIEDFKNMVSDRSRFDTACKLLQKQITDQILISFGNKSYQKAIDCIKAMRIESVSNDEANVFNDYMEELKKIVSDKKLTDFWKMLGSDGVNLISRSECPSSSVTMAMAAAFLDTDDGNSQDEKEMNAFWDDGDDDFLAGF